MNESEQAHDSNTRRRLRPPKGLLLSILVQAPLILWSWPLKSPRVSVLIGMILLAGGVVLNIWADRLFHQHGVQVCPFSPVSILVEEGPFRITRNPMYLGMVLISAAVPLIAGLYIGLWAPLLLAVWLQIRFILPEEDFLRQQLGMEYLLYASTRSRWLGWPGPQLSRMDARAPRSIWIAWHSSTRSAGSAVHPKDSHP